MNKKILKIINLTLIAISISAIGKDIPFYLQSKVVCTGDSLNNYHCDISGEAANYITVSRVGTMYIPGTYYFQYAQTNVCTSNDNNPCYFYIDAKGHQLALAPAYREISADTKAPGNQWQGSNWGLTCNPPVSNCPFTHTPFLKYGNS
jgi:hypothetical protein